MPTLKLTRRSIEALPAPTPSGKQELFWDDQLRGFGVLCSGISNSRTYVIQARVGTGKKRRLTVGATNILPLEAAREKARTLLAQIALTGEDPKQTAKRKAQANVTLRDALELYFQRSSNLSANSVKTYHNVAQRHLIKWMDRPLRSLTHEAVERRYRDIVREVAAQREAGHTHGGVNVSGKAVANLVMRLLRGVWNRQAEHDHELGRNPTDVLRRQWHHIERRSRLVGTGDLPKFYQAVLALPSAVQRDLVLLALFSGMRSGEVCGLRWSEIDLVQKLIRIPAKRMKSGKPFELPMSDVVADLLIARRAFGNAGGFVFPGNGRAGHAKSLPYACDLIHDMTGIRISPHDLRRTYASVMATCPIAPIAAKMLLSHATGGDVTFGYQILALDQLREAAQAVANKLAALCEIEKPEADAKIVRMPAQ